MSGQGDNGLSSKCPGCGCDVAGQDPTLCDDCFKKTVSGLPPVQGDNELNERIQEVEDAEDNLSTSPTPELNLRNAIERLINTARISNEAVSIVLGVKGSEVRKALALFKDSCRRPPSTHMSLPVPKDTMPAPKMVPPLDTAISSLTEIARDYRDKTSVKFFERLDAPRKKHNPAEWLCPCGDPVDTSLPTFRWSDSEGAYQHKHQYIGGTGWVGCERMPSAVQEEYRLQALREIDPKRFPKLVCLCGSSRFKREMIAAAERETLAGHAVLMPHFFRYSGDPVTPEQKEMLNRMHFRKIDIADEVVMVTVQSFLGENATTELKYARHCQKPVRWLEVRPQQ